MRFTAVVKALSLLTRTNTPLRVYLALVRTAFRRLPAEGDIGAGALFTSDWTSRNTRYWLEAFERTGIQPKRILEIGAWEGLTSRFLLTVFPEAHLTCVDTWEGGEVKACEHVEANFDDNMAGYTGRLRKVKARSQGAFNRVSDA